MTEYFCAYKINKLDWRIKMHILKKTIFTIFFMNFYLIIADNGAWGMYSKCGDDFSRLPPLERYVTLNKTAEAVEFLSNPDNYKSELVNEVYTHADGDTPLIKAVNKGNYEIILALHKTGVCEVNCVGQTNNHQSPLAFALMCVYRRSLPSIEFFKRSEMSEAGIDEVEYERRKIEKEEEAKQIAFFLINEMDADLNLRDTVHKRTPLHIVCEYGLTDFLTVLFEKNSTIVSDLYGDSPVHLAAKKGHIDSVRAFQSRGFDIKQYRNHKGKTPYDLLSEENKEKISQISDLTCPPQEDCKEAS